MSAPDLPTDPARWPRDPYRLLGVSPGVSPRDLKRAYLQLIRRYKPEHAPEQFRLIREAYEAASQQITFFPFPVRAFDGEEDREGDSSPQSPRSPNGSAPTQARNQSV